MDIKAEVYDHLEHASFCGMVFDTHDNVVVTDPRKMLCRFGWTSAEYHNARPAVLKRLLRAKSLSLAYQYPGCPILQSLANYGLRVTSELEEDPSWKDWYLNRRSLNSYMRTQAREWFKAVPVSRPPPFNTRMLVESLYSVPINYQIRIESYLDSLCTLTELSLPGLS